MPRRELTDDEHDAHGEYLAGGGAGPAPAMGGATRLQDLTAEHIGAGGEPDGGALLLALFKRACERSLAQHGGSENDAIDAIWGQGDFGERMYAWLTQDEIRTLEGPAEELQGPGGLR